MNIELVMVGKNATGPLTAVLEDMLIRLNRATSVRSRIIPEAKGDEQVRVREEGKRILQALVDPGVVVVLDERGKAFTSKEFAAQLGVWRDQGQRKVTFVIGGAYGLSDEVREPSDLVMRLSSMTFTHQFARVILAEQIYRAFSILEGRPYHH